MVELPCQRYIFEGERCGTVLYTFVYDQQKAERTHQRQQAQKQETERTHQRQLEQKQAQRKQQQHQVLQQQMQHLQQQRQQQPLSKTYRIDS